MDTMDNAKFALGSSEPNATADEKVLASVCPDLHAEMPRLLDYWYVLVVEAIEATGGPSLIDRVAPAEWLVERGAMLPVLFSQSSERHRSAAISAPPMKHREDPLRLPFVG